MRVGVCSALEANRYNPVTPTAIMRIWSGIPKRNNSYAYIPPKKFVKVFDYVFDDTNPIDFPDLIQYTDMEDAKLFDENIAEKIVRDFCSVRQGIETLIVHCLFGQGRSPAVAIALAEGFDLVKNPKEMMVAYPEFNKYVYELLSQKITSLKPSLL